MKKSLKIIRHKRIAVALSVVMVFTLMNMNVTASGENGWNQNDDGEWYYVDSEGDLLTGWQEIDGKWYFFTGDGVMQKGWLNNSHKWYYFNSAGAMQTGWQWIDKKWYYFNENGTMQTDWQNIDGKWYYFNMNGTMQTGWQSIEGKWYYFDENGEMQTGWIQTNDNWYYLNSYGAMQTKWQFISGKWYYFDDTGKMQTGLQHLSGKYYFFNQNGAMQTGWQQITGYWYYFNNRGVMQTGWQQINNKNYYFDLDGVMQTGWYSEGNKCYYLTDDGSLATDTYIDRYYVDQNGVWKTNSFDGSSWIVDGSWYQENGIWYFAGNDGTQQKIDVTTIRSINRLGYNTNSIFGAPQQSIAAYQDALDHGFKILLCDLQFTSDGVPVCFHDAKINQKARNPDGSIINGNIYIRNTTLDELNQYDYGLLKGRQYAGTKLLTLEQMLEFCAESGVEELYIEIKEGTYQQIRDAAVMAHSYGISISWAASTVNQAQSILQVWPQARVSLMPTEINEDVVNQLLSLRTGRNEVFVFAASYTILTPETVDLLTICQIPFEMGTVDSEADIINYWNGCYHYCSGIESNTVVASAIDIAEVI